MPANRTTHVRYLIVLMLFIASTFSYGDRVVLSIAADALSHDLHLDPIHLGYLFSGFGWAYALAQLPAGGLLDRYGSKSVYGISIFCWSLCAVLAGFTGYLPAVAAFYTLFALRLARRPRPGARVSRQRAHRRRMVPHRRARPRFGALQRRTIFLARLLRAHHGLDRPPLGLEAVLLVRWRCRPRVRRLLVSA